MEQNGKSLGRVIILFSGGYDSTLLLRLSQRIGLTPYCILYDYGQRHIAELNAAKSECMSQGIQYKVLKIPINVSSKLTFGATRYEGVSEWHVPARNLIFLSFAIGIAEEQGIDTVWYGANYADREHLFPDCYQDWVFQLNKLLEMNGSKKIQVVAPLLGMPKDLIKFIGASIFEINENETFSGYGTIEEDKKQS